MDSKKVETAKNLKAFLLFLCAKNEIESTGNHVLVKEIAEIFCNNSQIL